MGLLARTHAKTATGVFDAGAVARTYGLLQGVQPGGMGVPPVRGTQQYLAAFSEMPWLNAVGDRIATAVARSEWQLFVERGPGRKRATHSARVKAIQRCADRKTRRRLLKQMAEDGDLEPITEHPFLDIVSNANSYQTGFGMRRVTQLHIDLTGDAFWLKERDAQGTVVGVWPVPPHWVQSTPTPAFPFFRVMFRAWRAVVPDTEWVWFSYDDPLNPYGRGTSSARALGDELETDEYAAKFTKMFFFNNARPDLIVYPKNGQTLREGEQQRLEEDWQSKNAGFWRAFRAHFLSREVEVKELTGMSNMRSMQMIPLREHERNVVLQVYGLPPEILGVLEHSNRSTIDAASYLMARFVVEPRLEFQRQVLQARLVPEYDERLMLEYVSPVDEDRDEQEKAIERAPWALSVDEHRRRMGMPPLEDEEVGAMHAVSGAVSFKTLEQIKEPPAPPMLPGAPGAPVGAPPGPDDGLPADGDDRPPRSQPARGRAYYDDVRAAVASGDEALADGLRKAAAYELDELPYPSAVAARLEPALARTLRQAWSDHAAGVDLSALAAAVEGGNAAVVAETLKLPTLAKAEAAVLAPRIAAAYLRGADIAADGLRRSGVLVLRGAYAVGKQTQRVYVDLVAVNPRATAWAQEHAAELVVATAEIRERIRELIARANEQGLPPRVVARLLRNEIGLTAPQAAAVEAFSRRLAEQGVSEELAAARTARYARAQLGLRAMTIARTELLAALNGGQQALWEEASAQGAIDSEAFRKRWLVAQDDLVCLKVCEPQADEAVPIHAPFSSGHMAPPAHPRCRCSVGLVPA